MNAALQGSDPVIFFESQRIYDIPELFHKEGVPEGYYEIDIVKMSNIMDINNDFFTGDFPHFSCIFYCVNRSTQAKIT